MLRPWNLVGVNSEDGGDLRDPGCDIWGHGLAALAEALHAYGVECLYRLGPRKT
jgi:hypothetical protein